MVAAILETASVSKALMSSVTVQGHGLERCGLALREAHGVVVALLQSQSPRCLKGRQRVQWEMG